MSGRKWTSGDVAKLRPGMVEGLPDAPVQQKQSKYRNVKTEINGVQFDSKKEAERWQELQQRQRAGEITGLRRQVTYGLTVNGELVCSYIADFVYRDKAGQMVVEDAKGMRTDVYKIKRKLMLAVHGIAIQEV